MGQGMVLRQLEAPVRSTGAVLGISKTGIASGKHTKSYGKIHHFEWGKTHYFYGHFNSYFDITRGYIPKISPSYPQNLAFIGGI
jgi:hypothetical protein